MKLSCQGNVIGLKVHDCRVCFRHELSNITRFSAETIQEGCGVSASQPSFIGMATVNKTAAVPIGFAYKLIMRGEFHMTQQEYRNKLEELARAYGDALHEEVVDASKLTTIEASLKENKAAASQSRAEEIISEAMTHTNPVVECARNCEYTYPSFKMVRTDGIITGVEVVDATDCVKATALVKRILDTTGKKDCPFEKSGVVTNGHAWEYRAEKLAFLLAQRIAGGLDIPKARMTELENTYKMSAEARKVDLGKDPFSNRQMVKTLQSVIDLLAFVPNENGENTIKASTKDFKFIEAIFTRAGKMVGHVKVLRGRQMAQYIFNVVHMIVTGKAYDVDFAAEKKADGDEKQARKPVATSGKVKKDKPDVKKAEEPMVVSREVAA